MISISVITYLHESIYETGFSDVEINIVAVYYIIDRVDKWRIDWRHDVSEEDWRVGLDEKESGQDPDASN